MPPTWIFHFWPCRTSFPQIISDSLTRKARLKFMYDISTHAIRSLTNWIYTRVINRHIRITCTARISAHGSLWNLWTRELRAFPQRRFQGIHIRYTLHNTWTNWANCIYRDYVMSTCNFLVRQQHDDAMASLNCCRTHGNMLIPWWHLSSTINTPKPPSIWPPAPFAKP